MRFVVIDWESYFDTKSGFTLKKLTTENYCRDPRFEPHGCAIKWTSDTPARWYDARQAKLILAQEDWSDVCVIHHHAHFDSLIESHHYGIRPKLIACTLSMARMMLGNHLSVSLDSVRKHYNLPLKFTPYHLFDGKHWSELDRATQDLIAEGACDEVESIWLLFQRMLTDGFPVEELEVIDITVRMFTEPVLKADSEALGKVWKDEQSRKRDARLDLGVSEKDLQSAAKFTALLEAEGVEVTYKLGKKGPIPAFAATDEFMTELQEDENPRVRDLALARLGAKSTLKQTRAETLGWMANRGPLTVYLRYCLSGDTIILVDTGTQKRYKTLDTLLAHERVWDGVEFVAHQGLIFQGERMVIEWDGVIATPDHGVYLNNGEKCSLGEAKSRRQRLMGARLPQKAHWDVDNNLPDSSSPRSARDLPVQVRLRGASGYQQSRARSYEKVQTLRASSCSNQTHQQKFGQPLEQHPAALHQSHSQALPSLRWSGDQEQISNSDGIYFVCTARTSTPRLSQSRNRPPRQQWPLRTGQFEARDAIRAVPQYRKISGTQKMKTFDIYECGPRRRFMANGKIVSNCAAHTTRWGGGDKANWQNGVEEINQCVLPPDGYLLASPDCSQIECRILNFVAGQWDKVEDFRQRRDPYVGVASEFYGFPVNKDNHPTERQVGKVLELQCGYGSGAAKIQATLRNAGVKLSDEKALEARDAYRATHPAVVDLWHQAGDMLNWLNGGLKTTWGPCEIRDHRLILPNGTWINYEKLEWHQGVDDEGLPTGEDGWRMLTRRGYTRMWGSKLCENLIQALARVVVGRAMVRIARRGYKVFNMRHDDVGVLIPRDGAAEHLAICIDELRAPVAWLPGCPLDAEGSLSERYE